MDLSFALFAVCAFLAVVLALEGLYNLWASRRSGEALRIASRLEALSGETHTEHSLARARAPGRFPALAAWLERSSAGARLNRHVRSAGVQASAGEVIVLSIALGLLGAGLPALIGRPPIFGAALGLGLAVLPWWRISALRSRRIERFEVQFPEALDLMGRAMRAGHAFPTAVKMCGNEIADPMGRDFRILADEMNYGVPAAEALARLAERVPIADVGYFVVAVLIQRESGGNLTEVLDKISAIVRQRLKLLGEIRTLSAEGRLSAVILTALPFVVAMAVNLVNPKFMDVLWNDPTGMRVVGAALFLMLLGILWMRHIIRIRV